MKKLVDTCKNHSYVWLKKESVSVPEPSPKIITKEIYVCVDCGTGLDFYNLDTLQEKGAQLLVPIKDRKQVEPQIIPYKEIKGKKYVLLDDVQRLFTQ